jgi:protein-S-isoprenylcysteine O-methyltransferase Ste14
MPFYKTLKGKIRAGRMAGYHTLVYLLGLALLAWGFDDLAGFFSTPVRVGVAIIAVTQALIHIWILLRMSPQPEREWPAGQEHWHYGLAELIAILAAFGDRRNILTWVENPPLRWAGLGILLLGAVYAIWTNLTWVNHQCREAEQACDNPVLLSEGPYRWTRYPTLLVLIFYSLGFVLAFRSWTGLAFLIALIGIILRRIHLWEKMYAARYKQVWAVHRQTSKRIIPFLY